MAKLELANLGIEKLWPPAKEADVDIGPVWRRWLVAHELSAYFRANMSLLEYLRLQYTYPAFSIMIIASAALLMAILGTSDLFAAFAEHFDIDAIKRTDGALTQSLSIASIFFVVVLLLWWGRRNKDLCLRGVSTPKYVFDIQYSGLISAKAEEILRRRLASGELDAIVRLRAGGSHPYLVIRRLAPVPMLFPVKPDNFNRTFSSEEAGKKNTKHNLEKRHLDAVAGGILSMLGAAPGARFVDDRRDDRIVLNKHTRKDVQELPDTQQADLFLRFHQSTVERTLPDANNQRGRTCRYVTYTCISNLRRTAIHVLSVLDIVNCLENRDGEYTEDEHAAVFRHSNEVNKDNIVNVLSESYYIGMTPRAERFMKDTEGAAGPILRKFGSDDYVMSFDAARVWRNEGGTDRHSKAIIALRNAIYLVSRKKAVAVKLASRDILVIDNLRAMVARREDDPGASVRDVWVTLLGVLPFVPDMTGWWLRMVYGYPVDSYGGDDEDQKSHSALLAHAEVSAAKANEPKPAEDKNIKTDRSRRA